MTLYEYIVLPFLLIWILAVALSLLDRYVISPIQRWSRRPRYRPPRMRG